MEFQKLFVAQTKRTGKGLFAGKDFQKNQRITAFRGPLKRYDYNARYDIGERWVAVAKNVWIAPLRSTPGYYINHSCKPNAGLKGRHVVAMRNIRKGDNVGLRDHRGRSFLEDALPLRAAGMPENDTRNPFIVACAL